MLLRPNRIVFLFDEIAKRRPFEFSFGNRTPEGDSVLTDSGNLPIAAATRSFNADLLPDAKRVGSKYGYIVIHVLAPLQILSQYLTIKNPGKYYNISCRNYYRLYKALQTTEQELAFPEKEGTLF